MIRTAYEFQKLYLAAFAEGRTEHAASCAWNLCFLADMEGRVRDSLRFAVARVRLEASANTLFALAELLRRRGWLRFAENFFRRALHAPMHAGGGADWPAWSSSMLREIENARRMSVIP